VTSPGTGSPSALHVNDAAFTGQNLVAEARRRGWRWDRMPKAAEAQDWRGVTGRARRALIGGTWLARLAVEARRHDVVHVHSASTLHHTRAAAPRFVLHCHGSDVRTTQYDPRRTAEIRSGLRDAEAVFYSTPDLTEHVLPHRPDAILLPVPVAVDDLPHWHPDADRPTVVFASRWEAVKGLEAQLDTAGRLVAALGDRAEVVGLDWGPDAAEAARLGVRLVPRLDHAAYLSLLAGASVVVGQSAGILSASELEAMGTGAPLVVPVELPLYAASAPPVHGGSVEGAVEAVVELVSGGQAHDPGQARGWVRDTHGAARGVDTVAAVYRDVVGGRT
jgi:hypothetical protein